MSPGVGRSADAARKNAYATIGQPGFTGILPVSEQFRNRIKMNLSAHKKTVTNISDLNLFCNQRDTNYHRWVLHAPMQIFNQVKRYSRSGSEKYG